MTRKLHNSTQVEEITGALKRCLDQPSNSDVVLICADGEEVLCHRLVLAAASSFLTGLFLDSREEEEGTTASISLPDYSRRDVLSVLSLVYTGRMTVSKEQIVPTSSLIETLSLKVNDGAGGVGPGSEAPFLPNEGEFTVLVSPDYVVNEDDQSAALPLKGAPTNNNVDGGGEPKRRPADPVKRPVAKKSKAGDQNEIEKRLSSKRPLMMKTFGQPLIFIVPNGGTTPPASKTVAIQSSSVAPSNFQSCFKKNRNIKKYKTSNSSKTGTNQEWKNSYQRAKEKDKSKFKCDVCPKGFPLACLLKRHKVIHSDNKPFKCRNCEKQFTTKASWQHHEFAKHLGEAKPTKIIFSPYATQSTRVLPSITSSVGNQLLIYDPASIDADKKESSGKGGKSELLVKSEGNDKLKNATQTAYQAISPQYGSRNSFIIAPSGRQTLSISSMVTADSDIGEAGLSDGSAAAPGASVGYAGDGAEANLLQLGGEERVGQEEQVISADHVIYDQVTPTTVYDSQSSAGSTGVYWRI